MFERGNFRCCLPLFLLVLSTLSYSQDATCITDGSFRIEAGMSWGYARINWFDPGWFGDSLYVRLRIDSLSTHGDTIIVATTEHVTGVEGICSLNNPVVDDSLCLVADTVFYCRYVWVDSSLTAKYDDTVALLYRPVVGMLPGIFPVVTEQPVREMDGVTYYGKRNWYWYHGVIGLLNSSFSHSGSANASGFDMYLVSYCDSTIDLQELSERLENVHAIVPQRNAPLVNALSANPHRYYDFLGRGISLKRKSSVPGIEVRDGRVQRRVPLSLVR